MASDTESRWHVYMVRCADRSLYTGIARDLTARIDAHNAGKGAKYTRARRPVELVYSEQVPDRGTALKRELAIKALPAERKRSLAGI